MLTEEQRKVAEALWGRVIALAGPGSGKTHTAITRIENLCQSGVDPSSIVAITFTNRAAHELRERLEPRAIGFVGTIHSFARSILELLGPESGLEPEFSVWDEIDRRDVLKVIIDENLLAKSVSARAIDSAMARLHAEGIGQGQIPPWFEGEAGHSPRAHTMNRVIELYRERKRLSNAEDFDGLIDRARRRLPRLAHVLAGLRERWRHFTVDETQDNNRAQDLLVALLRPEEESTPASAASVFRIGDPLQTLYRFRGARPDLLGQHLMRANVSTVLCDNFRSGPVIVDAINNVAKQDPAWPGKELRAVSMTEQSHIEEKVFGDSSSEREFVVQNIAQLRGYEPGEIAVLCRTNGWAEKIHRRLRQVHIPAQLVGKRRNILCSDYARAFLSLLRLARNPSDDLAFMRSFAKVCRPTHEDLAELQRVANGRALLVALENPGREHKPWENTEWHRFRVLVSDLRTCRESGWWPEVDRALRWLMRLAAKDGLLTKEEELVAIKMWCEEFLEDDRVRGRKSLGRLLWWLLFEQGADEYEARRNEVVCSTIHLAKGLEWRRVYLPACVEGVLPSSQALTAEGNGDGSGIVDERRCFYVAISRAKESLMLTRHEQDGRGRPKAASRFLTELWREEGVE